MLDAFSNARTLMTHGRVCFHGLWPMFPARWSPALHGPLAVFGFATLGPPHIGSQFHARHLTETQYMWHDEY